MSPLRLAVAQPRVEVDPPANGAAVRRLMRQASAGGARLIQFPEGMLSGYAKAQVHDWADVDFDAVSAELDAIAALAAELEMWVVLGSAHPLTSPHRPHNSLYVIADDGRLVDRYDKRMLSHTEVTRFYAPGFRPVVFEVDGYRFGLAICVEINFPACSRSTRGSAWTASSSPPFRWTASSRPRPADTRRSTTTGSPCPSPRRAATCSSPGSSARTDRSSRRSPRERRWRSPSWTP